MMCRILILGFIMFSSSFFLYSQEVLKLSEDQSVGEGSLDQLSWLEGYWQGSGFGGICDEVWMPAMDNTMSGIFRYSKNDTLKFKEYLVIEEVDSSLVLKLKHFNRDLSSWEEKDEWTVFELIKIDGQTAYFNGLTYQRRKDELIIMLRLFGEGEEYVERFSFHKLNM